MPLFIQRSAPVLRTACRISARPAAAFSRKTLSTTTKLSIAPTPHRMSSIIDSAAKAAHELFIALADRDPVKAGDAVPNVEIKINDLEDTVNFSTLKGKNILVLVPGAFSPTCSSQVPGFVERYADFKAKGVEDIYVVTVNDIFVTNAWKKNIAGEEGKDIGVKFAADDSAKLASGLGLVLNAGPVFGGPRLKRGVVVINDGKVVSAAVEANPGDITVSHADEVIKNL